MKKIIHYDVGKANYKLLALAVLLAGIGNFFLYDFSKDTVIWYSQGNYPSRQFLCLILGLLGAVILSKMNYRAILVIAFWLHSITIIACFINYLHLFPEFISFSNSRYLTIKSFSLDLYSLILFSGCLLLSTTTFLQISSPLKSLFFYVLFFMPCFLTGSASCTIVSFLIFGGFYFLKKPIDTALFMFLFFASVICFYIFRFPKTTYFSNFQSQLFTRIAASGGMFGMGIGNSPYISFFNAPSHMLSGITSEIGWFGVAFLLLIYFAFLLESLKITCRAADSYGFSLGAVLTIKFMTSLILHLAVIVGFLPYAEIDLPFIDCSGSGLLIDFLSVGILLNISRQYRSKPPK
ncbi:MAG: FtsW/RodA/SpoVE family cell cycle protein [Clostridium sp.]|nr:FtsW/RodA/SpoVE family cell cycle protein [Clostridium sp.]